jgi:4-amino-4-deoxy-L-arabinose transferase-like glycosyltransferase
MYLFVEAWSRPASEGRRWMMGMWVAWGLAFMTKGPPGLLPLGALVAFVAVHDRPRLRSLFPPLGLLAFAVVGFTWFGLVIAEDPGRLRYFVGYEIYDRVFTSTHNRNSEWYGPFAVYLPMFVVGLLPWSAIALTSAGGVRQAWSRLVGAVNDRRLPTLLLLYWTLLPAIVFLAAKSRLQLYVLPLFVPMALLASQALCRRPDLTARRLARIAGWTAVALLGIKAALAYWPSDRDARAMAAALSEQVATDGLDEIVFVGMPAFYGLSIYLEPRVEGVHFGAQRLEHSRYVAEEDVCEELRERENDVFAMKLHREQEFRAAAAACEGVDPVRLGSFSADDNELVLFRVDTNGTR